MLHHGTQIHALLQTDVNTVLPFIQGVYINGCKYNGLCAAHSAVSSIVTYKVYSKWSHYPFISHYFKGRCDKRSSLPKKYGIYGIFFVLDYFHSIETNDKLLYKDYI